MRQVRHTARSDNGGGCDTSTPQVAWQPAFAGVDDRVGASGPHTGAWPTADPPGKEESVMRRILMALVAAASSLLGSGCPGGGGGGGNGGTPGTDQALEALVACTAERLPDVGELLRKLYPCLHVVDTNASHAACSWVPIPCTPVHDPAHPENEVTCPDGAGTFTFTVRYGTIGARVIPALYRGGPAYSDCWNGVGTGESCPFTWESLQPGSSVTASGYMSFVELSPDAHVISPTVKLPVFEANGCLLEITNLAVYLHLENLESQGAVVYDAQLGFDISHQAWSEVLSGFVLFGDSGAANLDLTYRGTRWRVQVDARTFQVIP